MKPTIHGALLLLLGSTACNPCGTAEGCLVGEDLAAGLLSVRAPADDDVWIVGASPEPDDGSGPVVLQYDGVDWTRWDTSAHAGTEVWWTWVTDDEVVFVGHEGLILELDRASGDLARVDGPDAGITFFGVWGASADDVWAVGQTEGADGPPALWRRTGGTWAAFDADLGEDGDVFFKVHGRSASDAWIVGSGGASLHFDGEAWTRVATDTEATTATSPLLTVDAGGERPIAVGGIGNGLVLEYDGEVWRDVSPAFQPGMNGVCTGADTAWVVGQRGARAELLDGTWTPDTDRGLDATTVLDWHGCAVSPGGDVWTVGGRIGSRPLIQGVVGYQGASEPPPLTLE